jgi:hypothetical protein
MTTIVTINGGDLIANSRTDINTNFANLNSDKIETSVLDTDSSLAANSDARIASQKAVKAYIDTLGGANASETVRGIVEEATDAEVTAGTAVGATGAKLMVTPAKLATRITALGSWVQLGETILGADAATLAVSGFTAKKEIRIDIFLQGFSGAGRPNLTFNGDTGNNYGTHITSNINGGGVSEAGADAQANIDLTLRNEVGVLPVISVIEIIHNVTAFRKPGFIRSMELSGTATNGPLTTMHGSLVYSNTSAPITTVSIAASANNILAGSRMTIWGKVD